MTELQRYNQDFTFLYCHGSRLKISGFHGSQWDLLGLQWEEWGFIVYTLENFVKTVFMLKFLKFIQK